MSFIKRITIICLLLLASTPAFSQKKTALVTLKGQLKGFGNQVELEDMSEFEALLPPSDERMLMPDSNGKFSIRFKVASPNYYRLGRNLLYLTPGDNMEVFVDARNPKAATFAGIGAEANQYLKDTPMPKAGSFLEAGRSLKNTPEATLATLEEKVAQRRHQLAQLKQVSLEFKRLENARIQADLINSLYFMEVYSQSRSRKKSDSLAAAAADYRKAALPKIKALAQNFADPSLMKIEVYRGISGELIKEGGKPEAIASIEDWHQSSKLVAEMRKASDKPQIRAFTPKIAAIGHPAYKAAVGKSQQRLLAFGKGDEAADFLALDMAGKQVALSSLKGKVIYLDLWATWCGPCMNEMPHFEKLKEQYKDNPKVAFVSLSIDDGEAIWKTSVNNRKATGYQWLINRAKLNAYNITGIPRVILIDRAFKIADMDAPAPSEASAGKAIDELLKP